jgi:uncharacterized protein YqgQ
MNKIHLRIVLGKRVEAIRMVSMGAEAGKPLMHQLMDKNSWAATTAPPQL